MAGLTAKQDRFVDEFLIDMNGTQAAIRAKYAKGSAHVAASRLLKNDKIIDALAIAKERRAERVEISQDAVVKELANLGFSNMLNFIKVDKDGKTSLDLTRMTREQAAALTQMTIEDGKTTIKVADKKAPLELLGKHLGMFPNKHEHSGPEGGPIEVSEGLDLARRIAFAMTKAAQEQEK